MQEGFVCVGLAGVWSWRTRFPDKSRGVPLPEFDALVLAGRVVYIVYDSDRLTNEDVQKAERALAAFLTSRGAAVFRIPDARPASFGARSAARGATITTSIASRRRKGAVSPVSRGDTT